MAHIPRWFEQELKILDPRYYVARDKDYHYWKIMQDVEVVVDTFQGERAKRTVSVARATFDFLNDDAMNSLRKRKRIGTTWERTHETGEKNDTAYLRHLKAKEKAERKKRIREARLMQAEGYMKIHKLEHSKTFI